MIDDLTSLGLITDTELMGKRRFLLQTNEQVRYFFEQQEKDSTYFSKWADQQRQRQIAEIKSKLNTTTNKCKKKFYEGLIAKIEGKESKIRIDYNYEESQYIAFSSFIVTSKLLNNSDEFWRVDNGMRVECKLEFSKFNNVAPQTLVMYDGRGFYYYIYMHFVIKAESCMQFSIIPIKDCTMLYKTITDTTQYPPSDAKILGYTYEKVNKDGSKDLRYKENAQFSIVEYGIIEIPRLGIKYYVSNSEMAASFVSSFNNLITEANDCPIEIDDDLLCDSYSSDIIQSNDTVSPLLVPICDKLLCKVANWAILKRTLSTSDIQMEFELGGVSANKIVNQLALLGIIEDCYGIKNVLVHNIDDLCDILRKHRIEIWNY